MFVDSYTPEDGVIPDVGSGDVAGLFQAHIKGLKPSGGNGQHIGLCPFHQDKQPSFSVNLGSGLWTCHAGCGQGDTADFAERVGEDKTKFYRNGNGSPPPSTVTTQPKKETPLPKAEIEQARQWYKYLRDHFDELTKALPWIREAVKATGTGYDSETRRFAFVHRDSAGKVVNVKHHKGPDGEAPYSIPGHGQNRLYPLHLLKDYDPGFVIYCEGEKDAVTLLANNFQAVTGTTGAGNVPPDLRPLAKFRAVVVLLDNDEAGRAGSIKVADAILAQCPETEVCLSFWPEDNAEGYDITDYFQDGGTADGFQEQMLRDLSPYRSTRQETQAVPPPTRTFPQTDTGQAEYFAHLYGERLRYDHSRKYWLIYQTHWWVEDLDGEVIRRAKRAARKRYQAAVQIEDLKQRDAEATFAIKNESRSKIDAVLALAQAEIPLADKGQGWDADPWFLGVNNGVVDLTTGELRDGKPEDRITKHVPLNFDPKAKCERWHRFISEIMGGNLELIDYLHRAIGYSLTGSNPEQCLFFLWGKGANGKTVFTNLLRFILGPYGWNANFSLLEWNRNKTSTDDLANIEGRRVVTSSETSDSRRLNEARIKALTGGDSITARHLYQSEREYRPVAKFWLATNHLPIVGDDSYGFWRRVRLIPFTVTFAGDKDDRNLEEALKKEAQGILAWAVEGCFAYQEKGLEPPDVVKAATERYRQDSDPLSDFINERCEENGEVRARDLYKAYTAWAEGQGMKPKETLSGTKFGRLMSDRYNKETTMYGKKYCGISLRGNGLPTGA